MSHSARWPNGILASGLPTSRPSRPPSVVNEPRSGAPIAEGTSRRSGGQAIRLHLVSNSFVDEFDVPKRHSARWPNGILTSGLPTSRPTQHRSTRGQRTTQQRANRRRHKPPIRRTKAQTASQAAEGIDRRSGGRVSAGRGCHLARSACSTLASRRAASTTLCSAISSAR